MRPKEIAWIVLAGIALVALALAYELYFGGKTVIAKQRADVFTTEYAAAYAGALNRGPVSPIASIESGEEVAVIWDTYGKDYWACYVRTLRGVRGWALCTSLRMIAEQ